MGPPSFLAMTCHSVAPSASSCHGHGGTTPLRGRCSWPADTALRGKGVQGEAPLWGPGWLPGVRGVCSSAGQVTGSSASSARSPHARLSRSHEEALLSVKTVAHLSWHILWPQGAARPCLPLEVPGGSGATGPLDPVMEGSELPRWQFGPI